MARVNNSSIKNKFVVYKADSKMRTEKINRETEGAIWYNTWGNVQKHKPHKICNTNKEAWIYSRVCEDRIRDIKDEEEYIRLNAIKTEALLKLNEHKRARVRDIIENTTEDCPEYFI